jgi:hypothetical protein
MPLDDWSSMMLTVFLTARRDDPAGRPLHWKMRHVHVTSEPERLPDGPFWQVPWHGSDVGSRHLGKEDLSKPPESPHLPGPEVVAFRELARYMRPRWQDRTEQRRNGQAGQYERGSDSTRSAT